MSTNNNEAMAISRAEEHINDVCKIMQHCCKAVSRRRLLELKVVGKEEQQRRDGIRRQESLDDITRHSKARHEMREEAARRMGWDVSKIDHEALDRADGRG
jgi:hypothetical protein